jgi:DNA-directed RNA polymerase sigma subunit (sigma70/sigma32)
VRGNRDAETSADELAFLQAIRDLDGALDENLDRTRRMKERIAELEEAHAAGRSITEVVPRERTPPIVQLLTESAETLHAYGSRVRRTEARALHGEGMTMDQIASLFGVSRQRISAILRDDSK